MKLQYKRTFDKKNRLIEEIKDTSITIWEYDSNNNIIHEKNWNLKSNEVWIDYYNEYDKNNNLIHYKDIENDNEYWIDYNSNNQPIRKRFSDGSWIEYKYDEFGNLIQETSNDDVDIVYKNKYIKGE